MLIWMNFYLVIYILLLMSLHYMLKKIIKGDFSKSSLVFSHLYILKYSKVSYMYLMILLSLAGLPPFLMFFMKSNYIIGYIGMLSFFSNLLMFLLHFINMLFYTQLYMHKNYKFTDMEYMSVSTQKYDQKIIYKMCGLLIFTALGVVFTPDMYFIVNLFLS